jgi:type 2 lantibiotic biosynthesis protein LanM
MAARASTLWERLGDPYEPVPSSNASTLVNGRLERWRQVVGEGNADVLARRLGLDGLDESMIRPALGDVQLRAGRSVPDWAREFGALVDLAYGLQGNDDDEIGQSGMENGDLQNTKVPFEDVIRPLVAVASRRLRARDLPGFAFVDDTALAAFERALLERLTRMCAEPLFFRFSGFRARSTTSFSRFLSVAATRPDTSLYNDFVVSMTGGGMVDFFLEYASLARMVGRVVEQWIDTTDLFLHRLSTDWTMIVASFSEHVDPGLLAHVHCNLSDPHYGGKSTFLLTFQSGLQLIYKPRNLDTEMNWFSLLKWLNDQGTTLPFRQLSVINQGDYGWVEVVDHRPCTEPGEAARYYRRTGMLLCLIYALGGNDCHFENIIANGEQPVLVDLETVMHPIRYDGGDRSNALQRAIVRERFESVIRTGMLPQWIPQSGGRALDTSALGAVNETQTSRPLPRWVDINTDSMRLERAHVVAPAGANALLADGVVVSPNDYIDEIVAGFRAMYDTLVAQREEILDPGGPLAAMERQRVRFIFRGTGVYYAVNERASRPECLRDGALRSIELDALVRAQMLEDESPLMWPLIAAERLAMERADVPHFLVAADRHDLVMEDGSSIDDCFEISCVDGMRARMVRLDNADLDRQIGFIKATMQARVARHRHRDVVDLPLPPGNEPEPLDLEILIREARTIASRIRAEALGDPSTGVAWMTVRYVFSMQRFQLEVTGPGLYDGGCGIGLFLASIDQVTGEHDFRDLSLGAVRTLRDELRAGGGERIAREAGLGGASGLGSFVYGLVRMGALLDDQTLVDDALLAAALITPERIGADRSFDVIGGSAGAILGLLALHRTTGDPGVLERATECGHHLLESRTFDGAGHRAWRTAGDTMLAGFAHGAAGIGYALFRLFEASGQQQFQEAAIEAISFENSLYSDAHGNWPDLRAWSTENPTIEYETSWCNGGPGVGLARLGGLGVWDTATMRSDIDAAADLIRAAGAGVDHLCCGNLGRADILLEMGERLGRPELTLIARQQVAGVMNRAKANGGYRLWWETDGGVSLPGFFQGTSGIGYALLRAAVPSRLPSILLWE